MQHEEKEDNGFISRVSGPKVVADNMLGAFMYELVCIGKQQLVGEIIKLDGKKVFIQVYEETNGLRIGDIVKRTRKSLSVELGPGILDNIFDGIQRPLKDIAKIAQKKTGSSTFIPRGITISALNRKKLWKYTVNKKLSNGYNICPGDVIGTVYENELITNHKIMVPPKIAGSIISITKSGKYNIDKTLIIIKHYKSSKHYKTLIIINLQNNDTFLAVRFPRPCIEKIAGKQALLTGQRVLDGIFPLIQGGTCAIPGGAGCGKSVILHSLAKHSNIDCVIYVRCGERGNEMAEILRDFAELTMIAPNGKEVGLMNRTCLVANTSNMPIAAREASIYTGITLAEYFRDQGLNVAMMADSTSRWAEALREICGRLGSMPAESGYPAFLATRLAAFYERAGLVKCLGVPLREGSVTIIGSVSPPGGDFADPVTTATLNIVGTFWGGDRRLAQRKHFPSINWLISFTKYMKPLQPYFNKKNNEYLRLRKSAQLILEHENDLSEIVQLVEKDCLSEDQKLILYIARILREDFLQQNAYTPYDYTCPLQKTIGILKCIITYYENAKSLIDTYSSLEEHQITLNQIELQTQDVLQKIIYSKMYIKPNMDKKDIINYFRKLTDEIETSFVCN